jgi:Family of unknown function (DUF5690)
LSAANHSLIPEPAFSDYAALLRQESCVLLKPETAPSLRLISLAHPSWLSAWAAVAAFGAYFCMYGLRKPFTAATYEEQTLWGFGYKAVLVTAQVLGYTLSKFIGIRVIAEMRAAQRARTLWWLVGLAQAALLLFALVPAPWNFCCLFLNGLPLGMVFGLVLGYLEGRRVTEVLTAGLCASFILADGVTKSVGAYLLALGVTPFWMPFVAGLLFLLPFAAFVQMLKHIPPPTQTDIAQRRERLPMTKAERRALFAKYATGLSLLIGVYLLLTILRSVRADFAPEIWRGLGFRGQPAVFTQSELVVMFGVVAANGLTVMIRNNRRAFFAALGTSLFGFALAGAALIGLQRGWLGGFAFMVLLGLGLYLPYVAVHTTVFERLLALLGDKGNLGFLMYLADSFGYLGYVAVLLARSVLTTQHSFLEFFVWVAGMATVLAVLLLLGSWLYFAKRTKIYDKTI